MQTFKKKRIVNIHMYNQKTHKLEEIEKKHKMKKETKIKDK